MPLRMALTRSASVLNRSYYLIKPFQPTSQRPRKNQATKEQTEIETISPTISRPEWRPYRHITEPSKRFSVLQASRQTPATNEPPSLGRARARRCRCGRPFGWSRSPRHPRSSDHKRRRTAAIWRETQRRPHLARSTCTMPPRCSA